MEKDKKGKIGKYYLPFLVGFLSIFISYVWESSEVITLSYRVNELKKELISLENRNCNLKVRLYRYINLANIDRIARQEKGMVFPRSEDILFLNTDFKDSKISSKKPTSISSKGFKRCLEKVAS